MVRPGLRSQLGLSAGLPDGPALIRGRWAKLAAFAGLAAALSAQAALAQGWRGGSAGDFDFYVLALTWSPEFCQREGERRARQQCAPGQGLGFTVHGLWPQYEHGFPSECGPSGRTPSRLALDEARGVFPDEGLARHEWRVHGTCSGKSPAEYFGDVRRARDRLRIPDRLRSLARDDYMTPIDIERAFVAANPGLRPDMISVVCRRGALQEVRVCLDTRLDGFRRCPAVDRSGCGAGEIRIGAAR
jgi:ribonuclease T2